MTDDEPIALRSTSVAREDAPPSVPDQCNAETWHEWLHFVDAITGHPVRYGPGRGLFVDGKFVVTHGPGSLGLKSWNGGRTFPSFHCTSLCNFALGWLTRRNEGYTHAGNIPELDGLLEAPAAARFQSGVGRWGGYGDVCYELESNGSTVARVHRLIQGKAYIDAMELYERRAEMPTFVVFSQSTFFPAGLNTWHHTGFFAFRDGRMFRIAADGVAPGGHWSGDPIRYVEITPDNIATLDLCRYRCWGVRTNADGSIGDQSRPIAEVGFE